MADPQAPPPLAKSQPSFRRQNSTILKLLGVGALILIMMIPLLMINGVLSERLQRRNAAVAEITASWGKDQEIIGPVLCLPYQYRVMVVREIPAGDGRVERRQVEETETAIAYFLPETLTITGDVQTQLLHRGIYDAAVFRAQVALRGQFAGPDLAALKSEPGDVQWQDAFVTIAVSDLRGTREGLVLDEGRSARSSQARSCRAIQPARPVSSVSISQSPVRWSSRSRWM